MVSEIDREIGHSSWRGEDGRQTDRYGKKYSWIACFEMYGWREALGLLDSEWRSGERTSDCDVDPSFPTEPPTWFAPLDNVLDTSPIDELKWLERGKVLRSPESPRSQGGRRCSRQLGSARRSHPSDRVSPATDREPRRFCDGDHITYGPHTD